MSIWHPWKCHSGLPATQFRRIRLHPERGYKTHTPLHAVGTSLQPRANRAEDAFPVVKRAVACQPSGLRQRRENDLPTLTRSASEDENRPRTEHASVWRGLLTSLALRVGILFPRYCLINCTFWKNTQTAQRLRPVFHGWFCASSLFR